MCIRDRSEAVRLRKSMQVPVSWKGGFQHLHFSPVADFNDQVFGLLITVAGSTDTPFETICRLSEAQGRLAYWSYAPGSGESYLSEGFSKLVHSPSGENGHRFEALASFLSDKDRDAFGADLSQAADKSDELSGVYELKSPASGSKYLRVVGSGLPKSNGTDAQVVGALWLEDRNV